MKPSFPGYIGLVLARRSALLALSQVCFLDPRPCLTRIGCYDRDANDWML